jgi:EmrB/QacA subfamily drug resistance transporter
VSASTPVAAATPAASGADARPWPALWALVVGFFMVLLDSTIVSIVNPEILIDLRADLNAVIWVTSAYLLAYAVPILVTGRLGDRFGPRRLYLLGLVVFCGASTWCGLSGTIEMLIAARVAQGLGAALMTPQTMTVITRIFPPTGRGAALGVWGSVAGVASLVGPLLGGTIADTLGWRWIFFLNIPLGIVAFVLALRFVPRLETRHHRFDVVGIALSTTGIFLLVFGIQQGERYDWGAIHGPITVPVVIASGIVLLAGFVIWERRSRAEPLLPTAIFRDRNFSLATVAISSVGFTVTSLTIPVIFTLQLVRGLTPTESALMLAPMAALLAALSPLGGRLGDRISSRALATGGLVVIAACLCWYAVLIASPTTPLWLFLLPNAVLGIASTAVWAPISITATRNLPMAYAGAGSGVYNASRQLGSVLGSAGMAVAMDLFLRLSLTEANPGSAVTGGTLPTSAQEGFSTAMASAILLPAAVAACGACVTAFFVGPDATSATPRPAHPGGTADVEPRPQVPAGSSGQDRAEDGPE